MSSVFDDPRPLRKRLPDWEVRLFTFLNEARALHLEYGRFDCAIGLVSGAVLAQTGVDLGAPHLGKYGDALEAHRYVYKNGWASLDHMMDSFLRPAEKGDRHRGNIVMLESDAGESFGIRFGQEAVAFGLDGLRDFRIPENCFEWSPL